MSTELQNLETEIKRTQLAREKLALADDLRRSERRQGAIDLAKTVASTTSEVTGKAVGAGRRLWRRAAMVVGLLVVVFFAVMWWDAEQRKAAQDRWAAQQRAEKCEQYRASRGAPQPGGIGLESVMPAPC